MLVSVMVFVDRVLSWPKPFIGRYTGREEYGGPPVLYVGIICRFLLVSYFDSSYHMLERLC